MRLLLSSIIGLFLFSNIVTAQNDPEAAQILDNVADFYSQFYAFTGEFVMKIENKEADIAEVQEGKYWVLGKKYNLQTSALDRITDGETVWTVFKDDEEVQITEYDPEEEEFNPSTVFTLYKDGFTYPSRKDTLILGKRFDLIDLFPISTSESYNKIQLVVTSHPLVYNVVVHSSNGTLITYQVDGFDVLKEVDVDLNMFDYSEENYPGLDLDIIDLR